MTDEELDAILEMSSDILITGFLDSRRHKALRVAELVAEVRRLREENAEMQITISRYQDGELAFLQDYIDSKRRAANG